MKFCPTCGLEHPDDVQTSHHPDDCTCGSILCGGTGVTGCIWTRTTSGDSSGEILLNKFRLIEERAEAIRRGRHR